jgi:hypothetical protein
MTMNVSTGSILVDVLAVIFIIVGIVWLVSHFR